MVSFAAGQTTSLIPGSVLFGKIRIVPAASSKIVLFLGTANRCRSRFAEILFNSVAGKLQLPWRATSRGLALCTDKASPMATPAVKALQTLGNRAPEDVARFPVAVSPDDFRSAHWIVALNDAEHRPLLHERWPDWVERVEFWQVHDVSQAFAEIEREVTDLAARLIAGGRRRTVPAIGVPAVDTSAVSDSLKRKALTARIRRETAGRRGKAVTTVALPVDETELQELATHLKQRCGTGGTVKNGRIEIQGDQRERIFGELERLGYQVKRD